MFQLSSQLLFRAVLSHLVVAMPPALLLGVLVLNANRQGLITEAQQVHLTSAARLADSIVAGIEAHVVALEEAGRILNADEVAIENRLLALRAVVASGRVPAIGLYDDTGRRDSVVTVRAEPPNLPATIAERTRARARIERFAVTVTDGGPTSLLVIAWRQPDRLFGYLVTPFDRRDLERRAQSVAENVLGPGGQVAVVDDRLAPVLTVGPEASSAGPFSGFSTSSEIPALDGIDAGYATTFERGDRAYLAGVVSVPQLGWMVGVSRPKDRALASVDRVKSQVGLLAVVAGLLAGLAALWLARQITAPVLNLTRSVELVAHSGFRGRVGGARGGELKVLESAFNDALNQLHRYRRSLRSTTQLRLKIARFLPPNALHDVLTTEFRVLQDGRQTEMSLLYMDLVPDDSWSDVPKTEMVAVLCDVYEAACAIVEEHHGRIDHFSGDSVIAIFLADTDEQHADAAVRAGLAILSAVRRIIARHGREAPIAVGVATGEAVVSEVDPTREVSVVGELVESVVHLQHAATSGTVRISAATQRQLHEDLSEHPQIEPVVFDTEPDSL